MNWHNSTAKSTLYVSFIIFTLLFSVQKNKPINAGGGTSATTKRVSIATDGAEGNLPSHDPSISADGRYIAFQSVATNLDPTIEDTNNTPDIYLHDRLTGSTILVSKTESGSLPNGESGRPSISADGRFIAYQSASDNIVPGISAIGNIFLYDRDADEDNIFDETEIGSTSTVLVSIALGGNSIDSSTSHPSISNDGTRIAFSSSASNLVVNDMNNRTDVFVRDLITNSTFRVSVNSDGGGGDETSNNGEISGNGRYVTFLSSSTNLIENDTNNRSDIFVHDINTGETLRVSVSSDMTQANNDSNSPTISDDGRLIAFSSYANSLIGKADTNNANDIFVHDRDVDGNGIFDEVWKVSTIRASVGSGGIQSTLGSSSPYISGDGRFVIFKTGTIHYQIHDLQTKQTSPVTVNTNGQSANAQSGTASISANGRYIAFYSWASNLSEESDTNGYPDVFVRDRGDKYDPCEIQSTDDSDEDGLPDYWETCGYTHSNGSFVDLPAMGADPNVRDIFIEIDYMNYTGDCSSDNFCVGHSHEPHQSAMDQVVNAFASRGINLHIDFGDDAKLHHNENYDTWGNLPGGSGGNSLKEIPYIIPQGSPPNLDLIYIPLKRVNFKPERWPIFHYAVFTHTIQEGKDDFGKALPYDSDFFISHRGSRTLQDQAYALMHELGHNLGLCHSGPFEFVSQNNNCPREFDPQDRAPHYISVMNILYRGSSLYIDGSSGQVDYSGPEKLTEPLNEAQLDEKTGLEGLPGSDLTRFRIRWYCSSPFPPIPLFFRPADGSINWDCDFSGEEQQVSANINGLSGSDDILNTYNDWEFIELRVGCIGVASTLRPYPINCSGLDNDRIAAPQFSILWSRDFIEDPHIEIPVEYKIILDGESQIIINPQVEITVPITLTNAGEITVTVTIQQDTVGEWYDTSNVPSSIILEPSEAVIYEIGINTPADATVGQVQKLSLTAYIEEDSGMSDMLEITSQIGPYAWFSANNVIGSPPLTVQFENLSVGEFDTSYWDFGDGTTSTNKNPTHVYLEEGLYTVTLTITNAVGSNTSMRINWIWVNKKEIYIPLILRQ